MSSSSADAQRTGDFIAAAKAKGLDDAFIVSLLRQNGYSERRAYAAFTAYYERELGMPVPSRGGGAENARDAFLYLLAFVTLGIWAIALVWLADALADRAFPSALDQSYMAYSFRESIAGQLASLLVAFPIYVFVSSTILKQTHQRPESLDSGVRKWLTYIALVVTAVTLVGDGVWFLRAFLVGDLTTRLIAKTIVLLIVAGGIFWYYLGSVRGQDVDNHDRAFGLAAIAGVAIAIVLGFVGIGSPGYERQLAMDTRRVEDLEAIESSISLYYQRTRALPATLYDLPRASGYLNEPGSTTTYGYIRESASRYKLCANFDTSDTGDRHPRWPHRAGETCFPLDASR